MKTARDILAQHIMWAKADWTKDNHAQADEATTALEAAGYVIVPKEISAPCPQLHSMFDVIEQETEGKSMEVYMSVRLAEALYKAGVNATP